MVINNPILREAYEAGWYYPYRPSDEVLASPEYQRAVEEGWHEWIESDLDVEAIKKGYRFDLSRDVYGKPCCFFRGEWVLHDGTKVPVEEEADLIGHVGAADHFLRFCEAFMRHTKAPRAGNPYRFIHWQRKLCAVIFGWVKGDLRRYNHVYVEVPKKNAKSALLSAIAVYMLCADGTPKAQVYGAACDRNQARIIYDEAVSLVKGSEELSSIIEAVESRGRLVHRDSASFYVVLSADAHRNEGIDSSCTLVDEIHVHPSRRLYSVLKRAGQARPNPLMFVITTAGPALDDSIWAELHKEAKAQIAGERPGTIHNLNLVASAAPINIELTQDAAAGDTVLHVGRLEQPVDVGEIEVEMLDKKIKINVTEPARRFQDFLKVDPLPVDLQRFTRIEANKEWNTDHGIIRANPSVGITFSIDRLKQEVLDARSPAALAELMQLNFGIVAGNGKGIVSPMAWQACGELEYDMTKLLGKHCYGGLDMSFSNDLTAFSLAFPNWDPWVDFVKVIDPKIHLMTWVWVPSAELTHREELEQVPYRMYGSMPYFDGKGTVRICEGNVIDHGKVAADIVEICKHFKVSSIAIDPNYSQFVTPALESSGLVVVSHRQSAQFMSPAVRRFSELAHGIRLAHGKHPLLTKAVTNAVLTAPDDKGNQSVSKKRSSGRIDALVATIMAISFATSPPKVDTGAWSDPGCGMWG